MIFQESLSLAFLDDGIAIGHVKGTFGGCKLSTLGFYPQESGLSFRDRVQAAGLLVPEFRKENSIGETGLFVGFPPEMAIARKIDLPLAVRENPRSTLAYEMEKYIALPSEAVYFDYAVLQEDKAGGRISLLLVAVKRRDIDPLLDLGGAVPGGLSGLEPVSSAAMAALDYLGRLPESLEPADAVQRLDWFPAPGAFDAGTGPSDAKSLACLGLGLRGIMDGVFPINLIPPALRRRPGRWGVYALVLLIALALLAGLFWAGSHFFRQRLELTHLREEVDRLSEAQRKVEASRLRRETLESRVEEIRTAAVSHSVLEMLRELTVTIPRTAWIQDLSVNDRRIVLAGEAESAADLVSLLEGSPLFEDAAFLSAITRAENGRERFRIGVTMVAGP